MTAPVLEPCNAHERTLFAGLMDAHARATRDLAVAFTAFCAAHDIPEGATLEGVADVGLMVRPKA